MDELENKKQEAVTYGGPSEFVHLHVHTLYSTLDGVSSPEQLFEACKNRGWPALAVTEHGHMASVPDNYFAAKENKIKYIPGCEVYYCDYELKRRKIVEEGIKIGDLKASNPDLYERMARNRHITVLAKNEIGMSNLVELTTDAYEHGMYYKPRMWFEKLIEKKSGLIILSGCLNGPISYELRRRNFTAASDYINKFKEVWGDDFYIEMQMPMIPDQEGMVPDYGVFWLLYKLAKRHNVKMVLSNDCHYLDRQDFIVQKLMMAIDQDTTVDDPDLFHVNSDDQFLKTRAELFNTFKQNQYSKEVPDSAFEEMCNSTLEIAEKCENFKPDRSPKVPVLTNANEELRALVRDELMKRGLDKDQTKYLIDNKLVTYAEQAEIELNRFIEKDFASYFLITRDLVQFSLANGMSIGPRGCTIPTSAIQTPGGSKYIRDIEIGENIIDGFGNEQIIENKFIYDVSEELFVFELDNNVVIEVTADHKLYIVRDGVAMLLKASEIKDTDEIIGNIWGQQDNAKNMQNNV